MPTTHPEYVPTRQLAGELVRRAPRVLRRVLHPRRPLAGVRRSLAPPSHEAVASFERDTLGPVELWPGYRDHVKPGWRSYFWQVDTLLRLERRVALPGDLAALAETIRSSRTLPLPAAEVGAALRPLLARHPDAIVETRAVDELSGERKLAVLRTRAELVPMADYYRSTAKQILQLLKGFGINVRGSRGLELGAGSGHLLYALAGLGPARVVGVDVDVDTYLDDAGERGVLRELLARGGAGAVDLAESEAESVPFEDASFDFSVSIGAMEHFRDLGAVFREQARVLRPGGIGYHTIGPWFSPGGGHSLCTLDLPWGHVRLTPEEFRRYVVEHRPHELPETLRNYRTGYHDPRLTLGETERLALDAGLELVEWNDMSDLDSHLRYVDRALLEDIDAVRPGLAVRDLITNNYVIVVRRASS